MSNVIYLRRPMQRCQQMPPEVRRFLRQFALAAAFVVALALSLDPLHQSFWG